MSASAAMYQPTLPYNPSTDLKLLTIGDPHFKVSNIPESEEMTRRLLQVATEMKPDLIICLGDILDRHENIHVAPLTLSIKFLRELEKIAPLYVIIGNHDRPNNSDFMSEQHPFNALKEWSNTTIIDSVLKVKFKDRYDFIFVPYVFPGRFVEAIGHLNESNPSCHAVFAHQEFFGCKMGAIVSQQGDKWPHHYPVVISGHIHDYQRPQTNLIYTGTPMQHAFGDQDSKTISEYVFYPSMQPRTIITNEESSSPTSLNETTDDGFQENRIDLGLKKRVICYVHPQNIMTWTPPSNKLVKLVVKGTSPEIKAVMKLDHLKVLGKAGIKVVYKTIGENGVASPIEGSNGISPQVPYLTKLEMAVAEDAGQKDWFDRIFQNLVSQGNENGSVLNGGILEAESADGSVDSVTKSILTLDIE